MAAYPSVSKPIKADDGSFFVRVHRSHMDVQDVPCSDIAEAWAVRKSLLEAQKILISKRVRRLRRKGRPSSLTPAVHKRLCELASKLLPYRTCAARVGVHETTLANWLKWGETEQNRRLADKEPDPNHTKYLNFFQDFFDAIAAGQEYGVDLIWQGATVDGRLALEIMARRDPKNWGKQLALTGPGGGPIQAITGEEALARLNTIISRRALPPGADGDPSGAGT